MNIVFSCDENYAPFLATTIASIILNCTKNDKFSFYVLDGGLSRLSKAKINALRTYKEFDIFYIPFDYRKVDNCPTMGHFSKAAYFRFFMAELIQNADRLLYLDVDLIVTDSLSSIYNIDFENNIIAAVPRNKSDRLGIKNQLLFNSGVMLIDALLWRKWKIADKLVTATSKIIERIKMVDQDVLNYFFQNKYKHIDKKWNVKQQEIEKYPDAKILHFSGNKFACMHSILLFEYLSKTKFDSFQTNSPQEFFFKKMYEEKFNKSLPLDTENKNAAFILSRLLDLTCLKSIITCCKQRAISFHIYICKDADINSIDENLLNELDAMKILYSTNFSTIKENFVFIANPYLNNKVYEDIHKSKIKIIYIPYGSSISDENYSQKVQYNLLIHNLAWKIYVTNEFYTSMYKIYCDNYKENKIKPILTSPKFDFITTKSTENQSCIKNFMWNIHFDAIPGGHIKDLTKTWSAFFVYYKAIYDFFKKNKNLTLKIRPHHNINKYNKKEIIEALKIFDTLSNVQIEPAELYGYEDSLNNTDVFISDLSSMIIEMAITGKPIILLTYENSCSWNAFANNIFSIFTYQVLTPDKFRSIASDLKDNKDKMMEIRHNTLKSNKIFNLSTPACEIIINDIFN
jgi:lipopolysaccharide biosynthesis glycosyltransferase